MCGLSGVAGRIFKREEDVFENLLYFMAIRGMHSTGMASVALADSQIRLAKVLGTPDYLIGDKHWNKAMAVNCKVLLGHNRYATKGEVKLYNAHPFAFKHVVGMHNGTIYDFAKKKLPDGEFFKTDSEAIISSIETQGIEKTVLLLEGAYCLVWYDTRDDTINMIRNKDRMLYYAFSNDHQTLFWASEVELLASAMNRNNVQRTDGEKSHMLTADTLMSWRLPKSNDPFAEPTRLSLKGHVYIPSTGTGRVGRFKNWSSYYPDTNDTEDTKEGNPPFLVTPSKTGTGASTSDVSGLTDHFDKAITKASSDFALGRITPQASKTAALKSAGQPKGIEEIYKDDLVKIWFDSKTGDYTKVQWIPATREWVKSHFKQKPDFLLAGKPPASRDEVCIYNTPTLVIYRNKKADRWIKYEFDPKAYAWSCVRDNKPFEELPYTEVDVNSNHSFLHVGRKRHKHVIFKGWKGSHLTPDQFNLITGTGCTGCGRTPEWRPGQYGGKLVHFISPNDFLCEFCGDTKETVSVMIAMLNQAA